MPPEIGDIIPTDSPTTKAVDPETIPPPTSEQLLNRVHARLSAVESTMASAAHRIESVAVTLLAKLEEIACKVAPAVEVAAAALPGAVGGAVARVAAVVEGLCGCGHDALHTVGGCTAAGCTCTRPPAK